MPDRPASSSDPAAALRTKQPNSLHCFVCGLQNPAGLHMAFYDLPDGTVVSDLTVPEAYQGYPGVVHGGILASMLDEVAGRAAMQGDPNRLMMTARIEIRYRKPVPIGKPLHLVGRLGRRRGRFATVMGEIRLPDGSLAAEAEALLADIPATYAGAAEIDQVGWRVYPDVELS